MLGSNLLRYNLQEKKLLVWDLETTSLNLRYCKPLQIAWFLVEGGKITRKVNQYIKWDDYAIDENGDAFFVHGISQETIDEKGICAKDCLQEFWDIISRQDVENIGFNILNYDHFILNSWREDVGFDSDWSPVYRSIDVLALSKSFKLKIPFDPVKEDFTSWQYKLLSINNRKAKIKTNLATMAKEFDCVDNNEDFHDAFFDVKMTYEVLKKIVWKVEV